ncbi:DMT family transporter [Roseivirga sp.]|uniref:DMT family transporter n=1 Tax=Roseivirga sp. TaxID=1964215 RepID=UPI002B27C139|nr:EamA family transporter [Roseivirga sp.]
MKESNNFVLFAVPALIWGSTWYVITFQLGSVDPIMSVSYRFALAGLLFLAYCKVRGKDLSFSWQIHLRIALQGILLHGFNYWLVYQSEQYLTSGLVAVGFSLIIFFNMVFGSIFLKQPIILKVFIGALFGVLGTMVIFKRELMAFTTADESFTGLILCVSSVIIASLGNVTSGYNSKLKIPVMQSTAFAMLYGAITMLIVAIALNRPFTIDWSVPYIFSLIYLVIFGSIIAFNMYLTLISKIGAGKAAYTIVVVPVVAVVISTIFEGFVISEYTIIGMLMLIVGNVFALYKKKQRKVVTA